MNIEKRPDTVAAHATLGEHLPARAVGQPPLNKWLDHLARRDVVGPDAPGAVVAVVAEIQVGLPLPIPGTRRRGSVLLADPVRAFGAVRQPLLVQQKQEGAA